MNQHYQSQEPDFKESNSLTEDTGAKEHHFLFRGYFDNEAYIMTLRKTRVTDPKIIVDKVILMLAPETGFKYVILRGCGSAATLALHACEEVRQ